LQAAGQGLDKFPVTPENVHEFRTPGTVMDLFTFHNLVSLGLLILLQAVLGFDNLLYIALESQRAPAHRQAMVRRWGIGLAVVLRILLLFLILNLVSYFQGPLFGIDIEGVISSSFNLHALVVLVGGIFILYTATREILVMMNLEEVEQEERKPASVARLIALIVVMNTMFSVDSILSAMALTRVFIIMATAIVVGGVLMIWLSDRVAAFLRKNRMYEVLGLFVLFVVGIMLISEGGHLAHVVVFGTEVHPMSKVTFYFVIGILVVTDIVQSRYQKKLMLLRQVAK
jgi:predicted tellurium resistance membrane protein TerC